MIQWLLTCLCKINWESPSSLTLKPEQSAQLDSPMTQTGDFSTLPSKHLDAAVSDGYFRYQTPPAENAQEIKPEMYPTEESW